MLRNGRDDRYCAFYSHEKSPWLHIYPISVEKSVCLCLNVLVSKIIFTKKSPFPLIKASQENPNKTNKPFCSLHKQVNGVRFPSAICSSIKFETTQMSLDKNKFG